jgi:HCOMODA/2-hydroxy-3-carboxy-muconic semialdehyde decarboxylase
MSGRQDRAAAERLVRIAARALASAGLVHAYGHCSLRLDKRSFLVAPSRPLGLVAPGEPCTLVPIDGELPEGVLGEVRIHREIYRRRPSVRGVVRSMPPKAMSLGAMGLTPRARHGFGTYFHPAPPLWDDIQLVRSDASAAAVAEQMGTSPAIVMRGNGVITAGVTLQESVVLTWYLEDAARVELDCLAAGRSETGLIAADAAKERATWSGRIAERMWDYLTAGDAELARS